MREERKKVRLEMLRGRHNFPEDILPLTQELVYVTQGEITWDIHNQAGVELCFSPLFTPCSIQDCKAEQTELLKVLQSVSCQGLWFFIKSVLSAHLCGTNTLYHHRNIEEQY